MNNYIKLIGATLIGAGLASVFLYLFFSEITESSSTKTEDLNFSYNAAIKKASPAVVNIYSEQIINKRILSIKIGS